MAVRTMTTSFAISSADAVNTTYTIQTGFQVKGFVIWCFGNTNTSDNVSAMTSYGSFGFGGSTSDRRCAGYVSTHASATINAGRITRADACLATVTAAGAVDGLLDVTDMGAQSITFTVDDQFAVSVRASVFLFGGDSITNVATVETTVAVATGNFDYTGLGFQPDFLLMAANANTAASPNVSASRSQLTIGAAVSSTARFTIVNMEGAEGGVTSNNRSYGYDGECLTYSADTPTTSMRCRNDFVSFLSNGWRLNSLETTTSAYQYIALAVKGGTWKIGTLTTVTDTTTEITASGLGMVPAGGMLFSHMLAKSTQDTPQNSGGLMSIGAFSHTGQQMAQGWFGQTGLADTAVSTGILYSDCYLNISSAPALQGSARLKRMNSDGFTLIMSDADPSGTFLPYIAVGPAESPNRILEVNQANNRAAAW